MWKKVMGQWTGPQNALDPQQTWTISLCLNKDVKIMIDDRVESCYKKPCQGLQILCSYHRKSSPKPRGNWNLRLAKGEGSFHLNVLTWWLIEVFHS